MKKFTHVAKDKIAIEGIFISTIPLVLINEKKFKRRLFYK